MKIIDNEELIVAQAIEGDEKAFTSLYAAYKNPVYNFIYRMSGNEHDAADIVQEVFFKVYKKIKTLKNPRFFSTWLFSIAKNEAVSQARRKKNKTYYSLEDDENNGVMRQLENPEALHPDKMAQHGELEKHFQHILSQIPENYRTAFILGVLEEKPYEQVAQIMGCTVGNVKSRVFRARAHITQKLAKLYAVQT